MILSMKKKTDFQKQVEAKAYELASGYFNKNEEHLSKSYYSGYCDGAEWQRNRVWHSFDETPNLSTSVLLYDPKNNFMSPPVRCAISFDDFFVQVMNKKYGANYTMWAYMDDVTPMRREELVSESNCVIKED